jgi:cell division protein FtsI/penicillin-binding protein 2
VQRLADGHQILFTIDPVLQDSALQIFRNREVPYAAAVILDVRDNAVLAMAGHSSMDPQVNPLEVLTTSWAPAASTFKLVTAASLLMHGKANARTKACFTGGLRGITDDLLTDNAQRDTRCATLGAAITYSHNLVVAKLALKHLTREELLTTARELGFEQELPFEFPLEASPANIPVDANERAKVAAGFWHVDLNPIHAAVIASVFARGGVFQPPHVVAQVLAPDGEDQTPALHRTERVLSSEVARAVGKMMLGTTTQGTARRSFYDDQGNPFVREAKVAGKTGSLTGKRPPALNYNWFIGYAPADKPEIAFAVVLANEPKWRIKAHYAARRLIQIYLKRRAEIRDQRTATLSADGLLRLPTTAGDIPTANDVAPRAPKAAEPTSAPASTPAPDPAPETPAAVDLPPIPGPVPTP